MSIVLFVTKDQASKPAVALAQAVKEKGHTVHAVCEGLSSALWFDQGFRPYFVGTVNVSAEPFTLDAPKVLDNLKPRIVVVCEGNPIHLEESFGKAANERSIPLVFLEDFWNGFLRNTSQPDAILTIDAYAAALAQKVWPAAAVSIVGSGQTAAPASVSPMLACQLTELKATYGAAVLYVGGETTDDLMLMIECMKQTQGFLIPRFHPKHKAFIRQDGRTREAFWKKLLSELGERVRWFDAEPMHELISGSDVTCSGLSLALIEAVALRRPAVVLQTPEVSRLLQELVHLPVFPYVPLGLTHAVDQPVPMGQFVRNPRGDPGSILVPYSAEKAYEAIARFL